MPLTPLALASQSYELRSRPASAQRLVNLMPEKLPDGARSPFMLKPTPGLTLFATAGAGPILASATIGGSYFCVSGDQLWRLQDDPGATPTLLGTVGTTDSFHHVTIAVGLTGLVICVPPRAYYVDFDGDPFTELTPSSANFPAEGASSACYVDGYYVFTSYSGAEFFVSAVLSALTFDTLDWVRLSAQVDFVEHAAAHRGELWLFGQNNVQPWYDTGAADFPFRPRSGAIIQHGLGAPRTVMPLDGSLFWLGVDGVVYRSQGYQAQRVSTHALEEVIAGYGSGYLRTASACAFMFEGHAHYALNLPDISPSRTFVYDCATQMWHERSSAADGIGGWAINTASALSARLLLGSAVDGTLYHMDAAASTEGGVAVPRLATLPALVTHGPRGFMSRLEVEMQVGTDAAPVALDWSDDGGINWTTPRSLATGAAGATRTRVATTRLGAFRQRVLRLRGTGPLTVYGIDADIAPGAA